ncbi:MAG: peptide/nickel transport system substrate-binding protein [Solirubrobacterales bacterium]|nr:peptide/nickel transport system substrate-binding protein [Solirubrobacterales bacterium]
MGAERHRPLADLARPPLVALGLFLVAVLGGCGGGGNTASTRGTAALSRAGGGGTLVYTLPALPNDLDPLAASSRDARLVTRQIHEPLVASLAGPYDDSSRRPGLAQSIHPSPNQTIWTLRLRDGVSFTDGTLFSASAVLANARRWQSLAAGRELLPSLFAVDAPRPDVVRFFFNRPTPDLPRRLSSPQLGIVAPESLKPASGESARVAGGGIGTGPFEPTRTVTGELVLTRNPSWWGTPLGLGPALDSIDFRGVSGAAERIALLRGGQAQVAGSIPDTDLDAIAADPLLTSIPGGIGMERSVRGIDSTEPISFSSVWLTTIRPG